MPIDLRDMMLEAQAYVAEVAQDVMEEVMATQLQDALRLKWGMIPDEAKEMLKKLQPETYQKIMSMVEEG